MQTPRIYCSNIVIGDTIEATEFAVRRAYPLIAIYQKYQYVFYDYALDGRRKAEIWKRNRFLLALAGLLPSGNDIVSVNINPADKSIAVFSSRGIAVEIVYDNAYIFDTREISGLTIKTDIPATYRVFDIFRFRTATVKASDYLISLKYLRNHKPFQKILFYRSEFGKNKSTDILTESIRTESELQEESLNDVYSRLVMQRILTKKLNEGGFGRSKAFVEFISRETVKTDNNEYEDAPGLFFDNRTYEQIVEQEPIQMLSYIRKLEFYLCPRRKELESEKIKEMEFLQRGIWRELSQLSRKGWFFRGRTILRLYQSLITSSQQNGQS